MSIAAASTSIVTVRKWTKLKEIKVMKFNIIWSCFVCELERLAASFVQRWKITSYTAPRTSTWSLSVKLRMMFPYKLWDVPVWREIVDNVMKESDVSAKMRQELLSSFYCENVTYVYYKVIFYISSSLYILL